MGGWHPTFDANGRLRLDVDRSRPGGLQTPSDIRLVLFVRGGDAPTAMRTLPVALLEVGARVSDLFTTVLARRRDLLVFRHKQSLTDLMEKYGSRNSRMGNRSGGAYRVDNEG
jgi:hypothetical protein